MALSMFLRNSVCTSRSLSQHWSRLATLHSMPQATATGTLPLTNLSIREANTTPILNSVREFRTSPVHLFGAKPHDHARLWVIEKATSLLLVPLVPLGLLMPNKVFDCALAVLIVAHSFWGLEAIAVDYVRASIFGPIIPKIAVALVYLISIATLGGLFYIISHDVGFAAAIKQFWAIKSQKA